MAKILLCAVVCSGLASGTTVRLLTSVQSPQQVGTLITLVPRVENMTKGMYVYRYSVGMDGGPFRIIRDFSQQREFVWSPALREHEAKVRVTVRNNESKDTAEAEVPFRIVS